MSFVAKIIGIPNIPTIKEVNVRPTPSTSQPLIFKLAVGTAHLTVLDVQPDSEGKNLQGKVYQWLKIAAPSGQEGWVRDDLVEVQGDGSALGYGVVSTPTVAFNLTRGEPIAPEPPAQPEPSAPPAQAEQAPESAAEVGPAMAMVMGRSGVNLRSGPGTNNGKVARPGYQSKGKILDKANSQVPGDPFLWVKIDFNGTVGWMREDFLRYEGNIDAFGLGFADRWPNPAQASWWVRDFNLNPNWGVIHHGWDHGGNVGAAIVGGPQGGLVIKKAFCAKCGNAGRSATDAGFSLSDGRVLSDPGWNYGYGHFVNVRYLHDTLPESTKQALAEKGFPGAHLFVNHAHLHSIEVDDQQEFGPNTKLGGLGNSGNSSGPHLHLEVRAHGDANEKNWARMKGGLMSPFILFKR